MVVNELKQAQLGTSKIRLELADVIKFEIIPKKRIEELNISFPIVRTLISFLKFLHIAVCSTPSDIESSELIAIIFQLSGPTSNLLRQDWISEIFHLGQ
jgi:hypothetical protein